MPIYLASNNMMTTGTLEQANNTIAMRTSPLLAIWVVIHVSVTHLWSPRKERLLLKHGEVQHLCSESSGQHVGSGFSSTETQIFLSHKSLLLLSGFCFSIEELLEL
jgi:hypothetical protein